MYLQFLRYSSIYSLVAASTFSNLRSFSASKMAMSSVKISLIQLKSSSEKKENILHAKEMIAKAVRENSSNIIVLPECWNSPYSTASFPVYAEEIPEPGQCVDEIIHPSTKMLCDAAKMHEVYIIGGSFPEREGDKLFNSCVAINPEGEIVGKHRKIHLFDIDVPGKMTFKESDSLSPGNSLTTISSPWGMIGIGICYDLRFPELALLYRQMGWYLKPSLLAELKCPN